MRELLTGHEPVLSNREILQLADKAERFFSTPQGNKAFREFDVLESFLHGENPYVDNQRTYLAGDYETHPNLFTVSEFGSAVYIVNERRLFSTQQPFSELEALEAELETTIPDFRKRLLVKELKTNIGTVASIKDQSINLFHDMWNRRCDDEPALSLLTSGWIPIQWFITASVVTKNGQRHEAPLGWGSYSNFLKQFEDAGTLHDTEWEISSFQITLPESLQKTTG